MKKHLTKSRIIGYLLALAAASMGILSISYARYTEQAGGSGVAAIAAWGAESTFSIDVEDLVPGTSIEYTFMVTNKKDGRVSQVAQEYSIKVETMGNLPLTLKLSPDTAADDNTGRVISEASGESLDLAGGTLPHTTEASHQYTLKISWPAETADVTYADEIDLVTVTVKADQQLPAS